MSTKSSTRMGRKYRSKFNKPPIVVLTSLRWLPFSELEYQTEFGRDINEAPYLDMEDVEKFGDVSKEKKQNKKPIQTQKEEINRWVKFEGFLFAVLAALSFSLADITAKLLVNQKYNTFNITLWKSLGLTVLGPIFLIYFQLIKKQRIFDPIWPFGATGETSARDGRQNLLALMIWGISGMLSTLLQVHSLRYFNLGDSTAISMSTPIVLGLFGCGCGSPGESFKIVSFLIGLLTVGGVGILAFPASWSAIVGTGEFDLNILTGIWLALVAMVFNSIFFYLIPKLRAQTVHFSVLLTVNGWITTIGSGTALASIGLLFELPEKEENWIVACGIVAFSGLGLFCIISALQYREHVNLPIAQSLDICFVFIWQFFFVGISPDVYSSAGALVIILGIFLLGLANQD